MKGINLKAARVYQTASLLIESGAIAHPPPWYSTIGSIPPSEIMTRVQPVQHQLSTSKRRTRKPSKMFKPQYMTFEEDHLRQVFYNDHPWELARPRIVLENDGKDAQRCDWSRLRQPGRPLDGESVIQRQLWLLQNTPNINKNQAYDIARKEFYALRYEEDVERRVAREEAMSTGAYFEKGVLEFGMELEDKTYEGWKVWATENVEAMERMREAAYTSFDAPEDSTALDDLDDTSSTA